MAQTVTEALKSVTAYPIPPRTIVEVSDRRGIDPTAEADTAAKEYRLAKADILMWLSLAPNVTQGGQSYTLSDEQRRQMRQEARAIFDELEPDATPTVVTYGYKGARL